MQRREEWESMRYPAPHGLYHRHFVSGQIATNYAVDINIRKHDK